MRLRRHRSPELSAINVNLKLLAFRSKRRQQVFSPGFALIGRNRLTRAYMIFIRGLLCVNMHSVIDTALPDLPRRQSRSLAPYCSANSNTKIHGREREKQAHTEIYRYRFYIRFRLGIAFAFTRCALRQHAFQQISFAGAALMLTLMKCFFLCNRAADRKRRERRKPSICDSVRT